MLFENSLVLMRPRMSPHVLYISVGSVLVLLALLFVSAHQRAAFYVVESEKSVISICSSPLLPPRSSFLSLSVFDAFLWLCVFKAIVAIDVGSSEEGIRTQPSLEGPARYFCVGPTAKQ